MVQRLRVHARTGACGGARAAGCVGARRKSKTQDASQARCASEERGDAARTWAKSAAKPSDGGVATGDVATVGPETGPRCEGRQRHS